MHVSVVLKDADESWKQADSSNQHGSACRSGRRAIGRSRECARLQQAKGARVADDGGLLHGVAQREGALVVGLQQVLALGRLQVAEALREWARLSVAYDQP